MYVLFPPLNLYHKKFVSWIHLLQWDENHASIRPALFPSCNIINQLCTRFNFTWWRFMKGKSISLKLKAMHVKLFTFYTPTNGEGGVARFRRTSCRTVDCAWVSVRQVAWLSLGRQRAEVSLKSINGHTQSACAVNPKPYASDRGLALTTNRMLWL